MLRAFAAFVIGILALVLIVYLLRWGMALMGVPPDLTTFIVACVGLVGVIGLGLMVYRIYNGQEPPLL